MKVTISAMVWAVAMLAVASIQGWHLFCPGAQLQLKGGSWLIWHPSPAARVQRPSHYSVHDSYASIRGLFLAWTPGRKFKIDHLPRTRNQLRIALFSAHYASWRWRIFIVTRLFLRVKDGGSFIVFPRCTRKLEELCTRGCQRQTREQAFTRLT